MDTDADSVFEAITCEASLILNCGAGNREDFLPCPTKLQPVLSAWCARALHESGVAAAVSFEASLDVSAGVDVYGRVRRATSVAHDACGRLRRAAVVCGLPERRASDVFGAHVLGGQRFEKYKAALVEYLTLCFGEHCDTAAEYIQDAETASGSVQDQRLRELGARLSEMGVQPHLECAFTTILHRRVESMIETFRGSFEDEHLAEVLSWMKSVALPWLSNLVQGEVAEWRARLEFHVLETFCQLRISELFDVVREFPESSQALLDLKACLSRTHQHGRLVRALGHSFGQRLLHPGANTSQILDVYISTIKSLRMLDPAGVLLEAISEPIKAYLRGIVTSLTDEGSSELFEELGSGGNMRPIEHDDGDDDEEDDEDPSRAREWSPDPIEADPTKTSRSRRLSNDILSMLVHIYGSKELFVSEYRLMLADKLLVNPGFDTDREVRNLELLKLRFGETSMHTCEIMVKDVAESKRINANVEQAMTRKAKQGKGPASVAHSNLTLEGFDATIVSRQFWPSFQGDNIELHPVIKERAEAFAREFSVVKYSRELVWKTNLGTVQLELSFGEGDDAVTKNFSVTPLHATMIMHFGDRSAWPPEELASEMKLPLEVLRKKIALWVNNGVIREEREAGQLMYRTAEGLGDDGDGCCPGDDAMMQDEDAERAVSGDAQLQEEMKVYQSYVVGMLTNFDTLPIERIHNMLKQVERNPRTRNSLLSPPLCVTNSRTLTLQDVRQQRGA